MTLNMKLKPKKQLNRKQIMEGANGLHQANKVLAAGLYDAIRGHKAAFEVLSSIKVKTPNINKAIKIVEGFAAISIPADKSEL